MKGMNTRSHQAPLEICPPELLSQKSSLHTVTRVDQQLLPYVIIKLVIPRENRATYLLVIHICTSSLPVRILDGKQKLTLAYLIMGRCTAG